MQFLSFQEFPGEKIGYFCLCGAFFLVLYLTVYQSALIPRKLPCLKNSLLRACSDTRLNVETINEEFNQYGDLLKLFLDTHYQYHSKLEDSQQIEDDNWLHEVYQNIFTFKHLVHNFIQDNKKNHSRKSSKSSKSKKPSV